MWKRVWLGLVVAVMRSGVGTSQQRPRNGTHNEAGKVLSSIFI